MVYLHAMLLRDTDWHHQTDQRPNSRLKAPVQNLCHMPPLQLFLEVSYFCEVNEIEILFQEKCMYLSLLQNGTICFERSHEKKIYKAILTKLDPVLEDKSLSFSSYQEKIIPAELIPPFRR